MKKSVPVLLVLLLFGAALRADDQLRHAQTELKAQGFFYGDVNGQPSPETTAAIRRYQIRNGLEVTGTLNKETLDTLRPGENKPAPPVAAPPIPARKPPVDLKKEDGAEAADRAFLEREEMKRRAAEDDARAPSGPYPSTAFRDPSVLRPPVPLDAPSNDFPVLFARTPYATAPREVQQQVLRNAQSLLASRGFYRDVIDGLPGPSTEEALLTYQRAARLTLTGRLDMETLSALRLLPGRSIGRPVQPPPAQRVYRGVWVN